MHRQCDRLTLRGVLELFCCFKKQTVICLNCRSAGIMKKLGIVKQLDLKQTNYFYLHKEHNGIGVKISEFHFDI